MSKKKRYRGHWCRCCGRIRPNEKFSGRNHPRHLCRDCQKLGKEELEFQSAVRNIDRCVTWEGRIRREQRKTLDRFLSHPNERVQNHARRLVESIKREQGTYRRAGLEDELLDELEFGDFEPFEEDSSDAIFVDDRNRDDLEIPF